MSFNSKTVFITGSRRGLGWAMAEEFAKNGANIIAHARTQTEEFSERLRELSENYGVDVSALYFDLTDTEMMKETVKDLITKQKTRIDVLVNNAGIAHGGYFQMTPVSAIRDVFNINLFAQMEITQLVLKSMIRNKSGVIINMSSVLGLDIKEGSCAYGVSKAAIAAWTKTLAAECAPYGIRANAIAPGLIDTDMAKLMEEKAEQEMISSSAMNRLGCPAEIAKTALFLASDDSSFINGQVIRVDGGMR